ncbi:TPA: tail fiber assembly protein [Enterobacter cloacae]|nr:tail fiber assembly protein [Enterobacter cloacae]
MINLKNFNVYFPEDEDKKEMADEFNAIFYESEDGLDWYDSLKKFKEETIKIKYLSNGLIVSASKDASKLCPDGGSVAEVECLPENFTLNQWVFRDGIIQPLPVNYASKAELQRDNLLATANSAISLWQTKLLTGKALTDEQKEKLATWIDYMDDLEAMDFSSIKDDAGFNSIEWPVIPEI